MTDLVQQHILRTSNPTDDSDWLDVRRRARLHRLREAAPPEARPRRYRRVAFVVAAAVAALVAAPAFGIGSRLVDLVEGTPAPPAVKRYFQLTNEEFLINQALRAQLLAQTPSAVRTLEDKFPVVVPEQARGVAAIDSPDGPIYLWAAPTRDGRQCWLVQAGADPTTARPWGVGSCDDSQLSQTLQPDRFWTAERPSVEILHVRVYDPAVTTVHIELSGSAPLSLRVASGHALGTVSKDATITGYVGLDASGKVVVRQDE